MGTRQLFGTDVAMAGILSSVRKDLGHDIDFANQADREAMGNAIIKYIRETGGTAVTGDMVK
jgi:hypothetical protein